MADGSPPPKAGEVQIDLGKLSSDDIGDTGDALAGLFAEEPQENLQPERTADTEQEETPAIGEHENGQSEQSGTTAIEPPVSWTAEEKQLFKELPPAAQQALVRRESERERQLSTQSQKASEAERRLEAERAQLANDRAQQVTLLQSVLFQLTPELQRFQNTDWEKLAAEKPAEWAQQRQAFDSVMNRWNTAQQQIAGIQQTQQVEQQKQYKTYLEGEHSKLVEKVPEFADRAKLKALSDDLVKYLPEVAQEIGNIADHRQLLIARDAMLYRKAVALREQAKGKIVPATPNRAPLRPAARQGNAREEAQEKQLGALHDNLRRTGTLGSAADLLAATGLFGKA